MATASVIEKSLSPSPPPPSASTISQKATVIPVVVGSMAAASCPCKSCLVTQIIGKPDTDAATAAVVQVGKQQDEIVNRKSTSDLEEIAYSILMLIMEGRTPIPVTTEPTTTDAAPVSGSEPSETVVRAKRVPTIKEGDHSKQLHERLMHKILNLNSGRSTPSGLAAASSALGGHSCSIKSQQCRIASRLKEKIRKCMRHHYGKVHQGSPSNRGLTNLAPSHLKHSSIHIVSAAAAAAKQQANNLIDASSSSVSIAPTLPTSAAASPNPPQPSNSPANCASLLKSSTEQDESGVIKLAEILSDQHHEAYNCEPFEADEERHVINDEKQQVEPDDDEDVEFEDEEESNLDGPLVVIDNLSAASLVVSAARVHSVKTVIQIEVYLLAGCCFHELVGKSGDNLIETPKTATAAAPASQYSLELLERWNISMITNRNNSDNSGTAGATGTNPKSLLSLNELFQAIRSYLYFSQISSWFNQTKGHHPKNIAFSVSYLDESESGESAAPPPPPPTPEQSESVTLKESKKLATANGSASLNDFDFQTFPNINLTFLNNNLCLINNSNSSSGSKNSPSSIITTRPFKSSSNTGSNSPAPSTFGDGSLTSTSLIVNLFSRKRRHSPSVPSAAAASVLGVSIPQIACNKLHHSAAYLQTAGRIAELRLAALSSHGIVHAKSVSPETPLGGFSLLNKLLSSKRNSVDEQQDPSSSPMLVCPSQTATPVAKSADSPASAAAHGSSNGVGGGVSGGRQHYYLPHWSTIMTTPIIERRRSSVEASDLSGLVAASGSGKQIALASTSTSGGKSGADSSSLVNELLKQQQAYFLEEGKSGPLTPVSMPSSAQTPSPTPVSASSLFAASMLSQAPATPPRIGHTCFSNSDNNNLSSESTSHSAIAQSPDSFFLGQSPKVLVSNHQLMMDLCTTTQNQLKLSDLSSGSSNVAAKSASSSEAKKDSDAMNSACSTVASETVNLNKRKFHSIVSCSSGYDEEPRPHSPQTASNGSENTQHEKSKKQLTFQPSTGDFSSQTTESAPAAVASNRTSAALGLKRKDLARLEASFQSTQFEEPTILSNSQSSDDQYKQLALSDVNNNSVREATNGKTGRSSFGSAVVKRSSLPMSSSPAPIRKSGTSLFGFDSTLKDPRSIKNALAVNLMSSNVNEDSETKSEHPLVSNGDKRTELAAESKLSNGSSSSNNSETKVNKYRQYSNDYKLLNMQLGFSNSNLGGGAFTLTPHCLLGSFEESLLNGRMNPVGVVDGFYAEIGASGSFFPEHATLPVSASFYQVCEDVAASPYLGVINLGSLGKRGYKVPNKGTIQVTLFNPNNTVVKMFVVMYDLSDMPPNHRTFLRQRTMYVPLASSKTVTTNGSTPTGIKISKKATAAGNSNKSSSGSVCELEEEEDVIELKSYLRYLIHLRFATSKSGKMYLHTNVKLIFARNKCEIDPRLARYEYKTFTEAPKNPRYSPKK